ncbi:hypothetical protein [Iningainema tapete]|uniref:Glycosyl hydrolase family 32 N-terminal domain-containing protein n=1 Tax=Iningainema tapete BLCC-T55 TaxID=2748662 RepID=A0A8J6XRI2_9CYAN|nr:hypothetical protein [Iningainema tapete]MBD2776136.1 hypothetical protein [Iningainema tapete BLCC-T55]
MPWQPRNKYCWDFWFAQKEKTLHIFFLQASQLGCAYNPEKRHDQTSVGHAILTEHGWKEIDVNEPALQRREANVWDNHVIWTGSILHNDGLYYLFYTGKRKEDLLVETPQERRTPQNIGIATSSDLENWTRTAASLEKPVIPNPGIDSEFDGSNWRDPYVIKDDINGQYYAFICARPKDSAPDAGGVVAVATSSNLSDWQDEPYKILYRSDEFYLLEVPQVFWRKTNDGNYWRLYLLFGPHWSHFFTHKIPIGVTCYVRSQPIKDRSKVSYDRIPWENEPANLLCQYLYAGKLVNPETELHPVFYGFQKEDEGGHFVGGISDPQWAIFADDGKISLTDAQPK